MILRKNFFIYIFIYSIIFFFIFINQNKLFVMALADETELVNHIAKDKNEMIKILSKDLQRTIDSSQIIVSKPGFNGFQMNSIVNAIKSPPSNLIGVFLETRTIPTNNSGKEDKTIKRQWRQQFPSGSDKFTLAQLIQNNPAVSKVHVFWSISPTEVVNHIVENKDEMLSILNRRLQRTLNASDIQINKPSFNGFQTDSMVNDIKNPPSNLIGAFLETTAIPKDKNNREDTKIREKWNQNFPSNDNQLTLEQLIQNNPAVSKVHVFWNIYPTKVVDYMVEDKDGMLSILSKDLKRTIDSSKILVSKPGFNGFQTDFIMNVIQNPPSGLIGAFLETQTIPKDSNNREDEDIREELQEEFPSGSNQLTLEQLIQNNPAVSKVHVFWNIHETDDKNQGKCEFNYVFAEINKFQSNTSVFANKHLKENGIIDSYLNIKDQCYNGDVSDQNPTNINSGICIPLPPDSELDGKKIDAVYFDKGARLPLKKNNTWANVCKTSNGAGKAYLFCIEVVAPEEYISLEPSNNLKEAEQKIQQYKTEHNLYPIASVAKDKFEHIENIHKEKIQVLHKCTDENKGVKLYISVQIVQPKITPEPDTLATSLAKPEEEEFFDSTSNLEEQARMNNINYQLNIDQQIWEKECFFLKRKNFTAITAERKYRHHTHIFVADPETELVVFYWKANGQFKSDFILPKQKGKHFYAFQIIGKQKKTIIINDIQTNILDNITIQGQDAEGKDKKIKLYRNQNLFFTEYADTGRPPILTDYSEHVEYY